MSVKLFGKIGLEKVDQGSVIRVDDCLIVWVLAEMVIQSHELNNETQLFFVSRIELLSRCKRE